MAGSPPDPTGGARADPPADADAKPDPKKGFLLTAEFEDQEALLAPPPEPVPVPPRPLPSGPRLATGASAKKGVALGVHRFVADPSAHPSWGELLSRVLEAGLAPWQAQVWFRLMLLALHGRDAATRANALGRLAAELDPWLRPNASATGALMIGPTRLDAPAASPVASPKLLGVGLFVGLDYPEAAPDAVASALAALVGWAASHALAIEAYGPEEAAPIDLALAIARARDVPTKTLPLPFAAAADARPIDRRLASGALLTELAAARELVAIAPFEAVKRLPPLVQRAPVPAARIVLMQLFSRALRAVHGLAAPEARDAPGLLAQIEARLASPLSTVAATALAGLSMLAPLTLDAQQDPRVLGLDLPLRYPGALEEARAALRVPASGTARKPVPRWVIANVTGADRSLLVATLMGRLPSADPILLQALADLAPTDFEAALHETLRETWTAPADKAAAKATLAAMGR